MVVVVGGGDGRGRAAAACTDDAWPRSQLSVVVVVVAVSDDSARWLKNTLWREREREGDRGTPRRRARDRLLLQSGR